MGWANCGTDSRGRPIGYAHEATCDEPGCDAKIDRGLSYACGDMHGTEDRNGDPCCEDYFCSKHLRYGALVPLCARCLKERYDTFVAEACRFIESDEDEGSFPELLGLGMRTVGLSAKNFGEHIEVIPSSIERWLSGATCPLLDAQKYAITVLRALTREELAGLSGKAA